MEPRLSPPTSPRLDLVDALRGFALAAIVLLHGLEHYNIYFFPTGAADWLIATDKVVWDTIFFGMAGKAYATFSLLFGLSFFIQMRNERARGGDFRARFAWRMCLLALFAEFHSLFYNGDILLLYAVVGLILIAVCNLKDRTVLILAIICMLQPVEWIRLIYACFNPDVESYGHFFRIFADRTMPIIKEGNLWETIRTNITDGQLYNNLWQVENGRLFQTAALFMFGMLLGRKAYFTKSKESTRQWKKIFTYSSIALVPLLLIRYYGLGMITTPSLYTPAEVLICTFSNFTFMWVLVASFTLIWFKRDGMRIQRFIIPYGRMSLTNYIAQSIIGTLIYWGWGWGLYAYTGSALTLLISMGIIFAQLYISTYWLNNHKQGPLEYLWKRGTWLFRN